MRSCCQCHFQPTSLIKIVPSSLQSFMDISKEPYHLWPRGRTKEILLTLIVVSTIIGTDKMCVDNLTKFRGKFDNCLKLVRTMSHRFLQLLIPSTKHITRAAFSGNLRQDNI